LKGDPLATKPTSNIDVRAYRVEAAAKAYGLSRTTLYKLLAEGRLQSVLVGRRRLILRDSLEALLGGH
jgi:excisionase family DNA binding protein